jgi:gliding motility-associated-like protein
MILSNKKISFKLITLISILIGFLNVSAQFQINGSASQIDCKCYQLTSNISNQAGSVWNSFQIDLTQPFDFSFDVFLGCNNTSQWVGADGIVFGLQPISTNIGSAGGAMGFGGVSPSIGVFIDTWQNPSHNDPLNDHISINMNGDQTHNSPNNLAGPYDLGEIEDCAFHTLRAVWTPSIDTYTIFFDGNLVLIHVADIVNTIFNGNPLVYWGFTGSTGTQFNDQRFCIDIPDITINTSSVSIVDEHCNQQDGSISGITYSGGLSPFSVSWNSGSSSSIDTTNLSNGTYNLSITDALGCVETSGPFILSNIPAPDIDTSSIVLDEESCNQQDGSINGIAVTGGVSPYDYYWNSNLSSLDISNLSNGIYELLVVDQFGCQDSIEITIDSIGGPEIDNSQLFTYDEDCGQANGFINGLTVNNGTAPYYYQINDSIVINLDTSQLAQGNYQYIVTDDNGCLDSLTITIIDGNYQVTDFSYSPTDIFAGSDVLFEDLSFDTTISWNWDFGNGFSDTVQNLNYSFEIPGEYTICLTSINSFNCDDTYCLDIIVNSLDVKIPNIFTPNNDMINDVFAIEGINSQFSLIILNRWGEKIFSQQPYLNNWDGRTSSGLEVPNGTYFYILSNFVENENISGSFQLTR